jgi:nucleotide-binding universal stress UspA family protein
MIALLLVALGIGLGLAAGWWLPPHGRRPALVHRGGARRILLPFGAESVSRRAVDAALRLAVAEGATLMPAYLASVPLTLPLDAPLPSRAEGVLALMEAIEQRAARRDVPVDSRISRGRTKRDALRRLLDSEQFDRIIVPADAGFSPEDVAWLLVKVPEEVVVLRPGQEDHEVVTGAVVRGHF